MSNTISNTLSSREYVQHIYDTGEIPANRPDFFDDILDKHVSNLEKWIRGGMNQPLAIVQVRIRSVPALAALLSLAKGDGEKKEDKRFVTRENGKRLIRLYPIEDIYTFPDPVYLIAPIFESVAVSLIYAMSGTGKTFTALNIGLCVAHGLSWMGHRAKQGTVWSPQRCLQTGEFMVSNDTKATAQRKSSPSPPTTRPKSPLRVAQQFLD